MHAIEIATRLIVGPGEEALIPTPAWPNFVGALEISGARAVPVRLDKGTRWSLDPGKLEKAVTPSTRLIFLNTPANPTGFIATREEIAETLAIARRHGLWIVADEIYGRITYDGVRAPSFHDVMAPDDKILFVQTLLQELGDDRLSHRLARGAPRAWTGDREPRPVHDLGRAGVQSARGDRGARQGEATTLHDGQIERFRQSRDILCEGLVATGRVRFSEPEAAFYLFARSTAFPNSPALALRLIDEAGVGARARRRLRSRRRGASQALLRPRSGSDRRSDPADGAMARGVRLRRAS